MSSGEIQDRFALYASRALTGLGSQLNKVLSPEDADKVVAFLDRNGQPLLVGLSVTTAVLLAKAIFGRKPAPEPAKKKRKRKHNNRKKKKEVSSTPKNDLVSQVSKLQADPLAFSKMEIETIMKDFHTNFAPKVDQLMAQVDEKQKSPQVSTNVSYKETFRYRFLFYNESLLKLLLKLDGVDTHGDEQLRTARKQGIKEIQACSKRLDQFKGRIDELARKGVKG